MKKEKNKQISELKVEVGIESRSFNKQKDKQKTELNKNKILPLAQK